MALLNKLLSTGRLAASKTRESIGIAVLKTFENVESRKLHQNGVNSISIIYTRRKEIHDRVDSIREKETAKRNRIAMELKNEIEQSKRLRRKDAELLSIIEKLQREYKGLPIVTIVDDIVEGASGIEKIEKLVRKNPNEPFVWLLLAETLRYRKTSFLLLNGLKAPFDIIGTALDVTMEYAGEMVGSTEHREKWTYEQALLQVVKLGRGKTDPDIISLVAVGRSALLLRQLCKSSACRLHYSNLAKEYLERALESCDECADRGEIMYYLAELHSGEDSTAYEEYLKLSVSMGFVPSMHVLEKYYNRCGKGVARKELAIPNYVNKINKFKYGYHRGTLEAALSGTINMVSKQGKKVIITSERIFDTIAEKFLCDCGKSSQ
jgi:hypothetical protein